MRKRTGKQPRARRHRRIRAKVKGTAKIPRVAVFRSLKHIYAQAIDDQKRETLTAADDRKLKKGKPQEKAHKIGEQLGKQLRELKIGSLVFDRGGFKYHGRVKAVAEGLRKAGLQF